MKPACSIAMKSLTEKYMKEIPENNGTTNVCKAN
jgi:hypothetical protein